MYVSGEYKITLLLRIKKGLCHEIESKSVPIIEFMYNNNNTSSIFHNAPQQNSKNGKGSFAQNSNNTQTATMFETCSCSLRYRF